MKSLLTGCVALIALSAPAFADQSKTELVRQGRRSPISSFEIKIIKVRPIDVENAAARCLAKQGEIVSSVHADQKPTTAESFVMSTICD